MSPKHAILWLGALFHFAATPATAELVAGGSRTATAHLRNVAAPPEWAAGCSVPTLQQCQEPGFLEGAHDDARGCGALQGANDWTCSKLLREAAGGYPAGPSIFAHELVASGVVASAGHVPQDAADASATSFAGELTAPASQHYGASLFASGQAATDGFAIADPREAWQDADDAFASCQEYAHDSYYEVANFWYEVGHLRHDPLRTFEIAFGPWLSHGSIGTRHADGSAFVDVREHGVLPSARTVHRNRFFDLPGANEIEGPAFQNAGPAPAGPNLRGALVAYDPLGAQIVALVDANGTTGVKDMGFYQAYFENLTVEAVPEIGLSVTPGNPGGDGPVDAYVLGGGDDGLDLQNAVPGDPLIAITGQVPLAFSGGKLMRRMFSAELDELYDLQREKDRLVAEWQALDRHFAGSGWTIQDLLDELDPELSLAAGAPAPVPGGGADPDGGVGLATTSFASVGGGGICCGPTPPSASGSIAIAGGDGSGPAGSRILAQQGRVLVDADLSEESAARKAVLDALLAVYGRAHDAGCLDAGVTYCDFSVKEFALEAIPDAHEEQQDAYEKCLAILPPPFAANLGQTRRIVDPLADTQGLAIPQVLQDEYALLLDMECFVAVDDAMSASHLDWIVERTEQCRAMIPTYQAMLTSFLADVALQEAKARVASVPELLDPDTGEIVAPGRSASWHEQKGSKYFGLEMGYQYAFATAVDDDVCNFDLAAGGDFAAAADVLTAHIPLVDVAAWVRTGTALPGPDQGLVDVHAEALGIALFEGLQVDALPEGGLVEIEFVRSDHRRNADVASLTTNFFLGPIPMSLSVGAGGAVGYRFDMDGSLSAFAGGEQGVDVCPELVVGASLEPYVGVYGFIEVALDIFIARAGVRGEVTILELSIPVSVDMSLAAVAAEPVDLELGVGMRVATRFESLSGRIAAFGEIGPCPLCARLEKNIVRWDGFRFEKTLYDQHYAVSIADLALVLGD